jgi:hypothetical protein
MSHTGLIDVQLDARHQSTLMLIERSAKRDIFFAVSCFLLVIFITTCAGIFGPSLILKETMRTSLIAGNKHNMIYRRIPGITPRQQFLSFYFTFEVSNPNITEINERVTMSYFVVFFNKNIEIRREQGTFSETVHFLVLPDTNTSVHFFYDRFLSYDRIEVRLQVLEHKQIQGVVLVQVTGEPKHLQFQAWIRAVFGIASGVSLSVFFHRLSLNSNRAITIEQKLTLLLAIASIIGVNPLFLFHYFNPTLMQENLNALLYRLFTTFTFLFILIVIGEVTSNHATDTPIASKVIFCLILFIIEVIDLITSDESDVLRIPESGNVMDYVINAFYIVFLLWFVWLSIIQKKYVDDTEKFKFAVYVGVSLVVIFCTISDRVLRKLNVFETTSGLFGLHMGSLHSFVLLMTFCHWPYDANIDELYIAPEDEKDQTVHDLFDRNDLNL